MFPNGATTSLIFFLFNLICSSVEEMYSLKAQALRKAFLLKGNLGRTIDNELEENVWEHRLLQVQNLQRSKWKITQSVSSR